MLNRLRLFETACEIFKGHTTTEETRIYVLVAENENVETLPDAQPPAAIAFAVGDDTAAFERVQQIYAHRIFRKSGIYFQKDLLKALAGFANSASMESMLIAMEKLFRLPAAAGNARFQYRVVTETENSNDSEMIDVPTVELISPSAITFSQFLISEMLPNAH